ncbi:MAG: DNA translocase FtsK 4TM domain-containing protein, partial [Hyphococcus sp.]
MSRRSRTYARRSARSPDQFAELVDRLREWGRNILMRAGGLALVLLGVWMTASLATFSISDPSLNTATAAPVQNLGGAPGAALADLLLQLFGGGAFLLVPPMMIWGALAFLNGAPAETPPVFWRRLAMMSVTLVAGAAAIAALPTPAAWPFVAGPGGIAGDAILGAVAGLLGRVGLSAGAGVAAAAFAALGCCAYLVACGLTRDRALEAWWAIEDSYFAARDFVVEHYQTLRGAGEDADEDGDLFEEDADDVDESGEPVLAAPARKRKIIRKKTKDRESRRERREAQPVLPVFSAGDYELP